jgi:hypothetical protein
MFLPARNLSGMKLCEKLAVNFRKNSEWHEKKRSTGN